MRLLIETDAGFGFAELTGILTAVIAVLALVLPWRGRVDARLRYRLGARNVYFFAWRMIEDILDKAQEGKDCSRSASELNAVTEGLDAIKLDALEPTSLIQSAIELRYAWNVAALLASGQARHPKDSLSGLKDRASRAMDAFDLQVYRDGGQPRLKSVTPEHRWFRLIYAAKHRNKPLPEPRVKSAPARTEAGD